MGRRALALKRISCIGTRSSILTRGVTACYSFKIKTNFWSNIIHVYCQKIEYSFMVLSGITTDSIVQRTLFTKLSRELVRAVTLESIWSVLTSTTVLTGDSFAACLT